MNAQDGRALRKASKRGRVAVTRLLVEHKADFSLIFHDDDGKALQGISVDDHKAVIQLLREKLQVSYPIRDKDHQMERQQLL